MGKRSAARQRGRKKSQHSTQALTPSTSGVTLSEKDSSGSRVAKPKPSNPGYTTPVDAVQNPASKSPGHKQPQGFSIIPANRVDRLLSVGGIVIGITLFLYAKTPVMVVFGCAAIFALLIHPLWHLPWIQGKRWQRIVAAVVLVGICMLMAYGAWPDMDIQQKLNEQSQKLNEQTQKLDEQSKQLNETQRKLDEITRLLKEQSPTATPEALQKKFSQGYVIGKLGSGMAALPYENRLSPNFHVDWSRAYARDLGNGYISVRLPDITIQPLNIVAAELVATLPKKTGADVKAFSASGVTEYVEVLAVAPDGGVVVAVGLVKT